jgi:hypothetical protein
MLPPDVATASADAAEPAAKRESPRRLDVVAFAGHQRERRTRAADLQELVVLDVLGERRRIARGYRRAVGTLLG